MNEDGFVHEQFCLKGARSGPKLWSPQSRTWGPYSKSVTVLNVSRTILQGARTHNVCMSHVQGDLLAFPQVSRLWALEGNGDKAVSFQSLLASALKAKEFSFPFRVEKPLQSSNLTYGSRMHHCLLQATKAQPSVLLSSLVRVER